MRRISKGFDFIAPIYDALALAVFGNDIRKSQVHFFHVVKEHSTILVLGGGTGWILRYLLKNKSHCEVWYIEASQKMIQKARQKDSGNNRIYFIHGTQNDIPENVQYDVVVANFYFDMFTDRSLDAIIDRIRRVLLPTSQLVVTDFVHSAKPHHRILLWLMYRFFRLTCGIEAGALPDWQRKITEKKMHASWCDFFYDGFIQSILYSPLKGG